MNQLIGNMQKNREVTFEAKFMENLGAIDTAVGWGWGA